MDSNPHQPRHQAGTLWSAYFRLNPVSRQDFCTQTTPRSGGALSAIFFLSVSPICLLFATRHTASPPILPHVLTAADWVPHRHQSEPGTLGLSCRGPASASQGWPGE